MLVIITILISACSPSPERSDTDIKEAANIQSITQSRPYLIFPGTCRAALAYYKECFGGEIILLQTFADTPMKVPEKYKDSIFNSEFRADNLKFMASDDISGDTDIMGRNFALFVTFSDDKVKKEVFAKLSEGGRVLFPITDNFGMVTDKFGIQWMLETRRTE